MIIDTHAHYDDRAFDPDREEILAALFGAGVDRVVNICSDRGSLRTTQALAGDHDFIYCALGIHPSDCADMTEDWIEEIRAGLSFEKAVAVGEIGLDYYWPEPDHAIQQHWFRRQLALARETGMPVVIHSREAAADTLRILQEEHAEEIGGVLHCFSYSIEMAREFIRLGFYIGIGGVVTFKNARKLKEVAAGIPLERILLETDCPYLAPVPYRGKRNSSLYLPLVADQIAALRGISAEEVIRVTRQNAMAMYRMKGE